MSDSTGLGSRENQLGCLLAYFLFLARDGGSLFQFIPLTFEDNHDMDVTRAFLLHSFPITA